MAFGTVIRPLPAPGAEPKSVVSTGHHFWYIGNGPSAITKLDIWTGTSIRTIATGVVFGMTFDGVDLWYITGGNANRFKIDTGTSIVEFGLPAASTDLCWDGDGLWVCYQNRFVGKLSRMGVLTTVYILAAGAFAGIAFDGTHLYLANDATNVLHRISPVTGTIIDTVASPSTSPRGLCWDGRTLWHCDSQSDVIYQIAVS